MACGDNLVVTVVGRLGEGLGAVDAGAGVVAGGDWVRDRWGGGGVEALIFLGQ